LWVVEVPPGAVVVLVEVDGGTTAWWLMCDEVVITK
jgi:hypothetical protein